MLKENEQKCLPRNGVDGMPIQQPYNCEQRVHNGYSLYQKEIFLVHISNLGLLLSTLG